MKVELCSTNELFAALRDNYNGYVADVTIDAPPIERITTSATSSNETYSLLSKIYLAKQNRLIRFLFSNENLRHSAKIPYRRIEQQITDLPVVIEASADSIMTLRQEDKRYNIIAMNQKWTYDSFGFRLPLSELPNILTLEATPTELSDATSFSAEIKDYATLLQILINSLYRRPPQLTYFIDSPEKRKLLTARFTESERNTSVAVIQKNTLVQDNLYKDLQEDIRKIKQYFDKEFSIAMKLVEGEVENFNSLLKHFYDLNKKIDTFEKIQKQLCSHKHTIDTALDNQNVAIDSQNTIILKLEKQISALALSQQSLSPQKPAIPPNGQQKTKEDDSVISIQDLERKIEIQNPNVDFSQIGGCKKAKEEILRIFDDIKNPERTAFFGRDPQTQKGYLVIGESGCGKTMLVTALATLLRKEWPDQVKFYMASYADVTSVYRGGEAQATAKMFELIEKNETLGLKTLLLLDEIHTFGQRISGYKNEARDTLLNKLNGVKDYKGLILFGATDKDLNSLDPALIRDGRLGTLIKIEQPTQEERAETLTIYLRQKQAIASKSGNARLFGDVDTERIAAEISDFNGSSIAGMMEDVIKTKETQTRKKAGACTEKEFIAAFTPITTHDFLEAIKLQTKTGERMGFDIKA